MTGGTYQWFGPSVLPELPDHLIERLRLATPAPPPPRPILPTVGDGSAWAETAMADEADEVRRSAHGGRNHRLNRAAFSLGQIVAGGLLDAGRVTEALRHAALVAGLGARESALTIRSGLRAGMLYPRQPPDQAVTVASRGRA